MTTSRVGMNRLQSLGSPFRLGLPSAGYPPVLRGIFPNECFNGLGVLFGDPADGIFLCGPFFGKNDALDAEFKLILVSDTAAIAYGHRHIVYSCHDGHTLERASLSTEEVHKQTFSASIVVRNKTEAVALAANRGHEFSSPFLVDDLLAMTFTHIANVRIEVLVVQGAGHAEEIEAKQADDVAQDFIVAKVACDQDDAFAFLHEPLDVFYILVLAILVPVTPFGKKGGKQDVHPQHASMFKAAFGGLFQPDWALVRIGKAEIHQSPFSVTCTTEPPQFSTNTGYCQCSACRYDVQQGRNQTHACIHTPVQNGVGFLSSSSLSRLFHSTIIRERGLLSRGVRGIGLQRVAATAKRPI